MKPSVTPIVVSGGFDDIRCDGIRFLHEASRLGPLHILLWTDAALRAATGREPKFPESERQYFLQSLRYVDRLDLVDAPSDPHALPTATLPKSCTWVVPSPEDNPAKQAFCKAQGLQYRVLSERDLAGFPEPPARAANASPRKKVIVTGCYDWFHSGHVRFFEEVSELGDLYVVVGHDANIRLLKGEGHPMFNEDQRRYIVGSVRYVTQSLISTGHGWLDAEPEIERLRPDMYAVNEDGDKPEKRDYCQKHGIEYVVLKRLPKPGLPRRQSTNLRGF
jgi:cytidyltransferase-like protein